MVGPIERIVIVGAGQAGGWCARALRDEGYVESIVLVGDEEHPPHERPPLSKDVLLGRAPAASTYLFRDDAWKQLAVERWIITIPTITPSNASWRKALMFCLALFCMRR